MAVADMARSPTGIITKERYAFVAGGAAGNLTVTGIRPDVGDRIISVVAIPAEVAGGAAGGVHTVSTAEDTANTLDIDTGLAAVNGFSLLVVTAAGVHRPLADAAISVSGGTITVADGAATFVVTATDLIYWTATGSETASTAGTDLTSEFSITANDTINNAAGTATTGQLVFVRWYDADWGEQTQLAQLA